MRFQGSEGLESLVQFQVSEHFVSLIGNSHNKNDIQSLDRWCTEQRTIRRGYGEARSN
jgi:hypothetical protein